MQWSGRELRVMQCQQALENRNSILSEYPLTRNMR